MLLKVSIFFLLYLSGLNCVLYIGKTYSIQEFKKLNICTSKVCLKDVKRFMSYVSHKNDSDPCVNFDEFACGGFYKDRTTKYKYGLIGFDTDLIAQYNGYLKTILEQKILDNEPKVFKFVKTYYQKCVISDYGSEEISGFQSLMNEFGKYPYYNEKWKPSDFGTLNIVKNYFEDNPTSEEWKQIDNRNLTGYEKYLFFNTLLRNRPTKPPIVDIWKPSEFNVTKALILEHEFIFKTFLKETSDTVIVIEMKINFGSEVYHGDRVGTELPCELSDFIYDDCEGEIKTTAIQDLDSYLNITSGLDWLHIFRNIHKTVDMNNDTEVFLYFNDKNDMKIFDFKNRRTLAHIFMKYLISVKKDFHDLFPKPEKTHYRYDICIENLMRFFKFPLEIMFQMKYGNETTIKAFKDFHNKFNLIEKGSNETIQVGYPDELTTPELLNDVYKHLKLGDYELYGLHHIMMEFNFNLFRKTIKSVSSTNITESAKEIYKNCGELERKSFRPEYREFTGSYLMGVKPDVKVKPEGFTDFNSHYHSYDYSYDFDLHFPCKGRDNTLVYKIKDTLYPLFHPVRPYFVNLAYYAYKKGNQREVNYQKHYSNYVKKFGSEKNLPRFLMTNQQMFEIIRYQSKCSKKLNGDVSNIDSPRKSIFNCQDTNQEVIEESAEVYEERKIQVFQERKEVLKEYEGLEKAVERLENIIGDINESNVTFDLFKMN